MKTTLLNLFRRIFRIPVLERMLVKLTRGKSPTAFISRFPPSHFLYPKDSTREVLRDGIHYRLDLSDAVDWYIYFGFRESSRMKLYSLIKNGDVVLDIGSNVGDVTMHCAKITGKEGIVLAFEPDPENYRRLRQNLDLNNFSNIQAFNFGFGNTAGKFRMGLTRKDNKGMTHIISGESGDFVSEAEIKTLNSFSGTSSYPSRVNLVKIDVEGFETNVLKGGKEFFKKYKPVLFIEVVDQHLRKQNTTPEELVSVLNSYGYKMRSAENDSNILPGMDFNGCHFDIIAVTG